MQSALRALRRFTLVQAFSEMLTICSSQLQVFEKVSPRSLCEEVSSNTIHRDRRWGTEFFFEKISIDKVLLELKVASQLLALMEVVLTFLLRSCPAWSWQSTTIYKLVSSANYQLEHPMCLTMSFLKNRNRSRPRIEP